MSAPFAPVPLLFLSPPDSEFFALLQEANQLVVREPPILERIEADLDRHAKEKKAMRIQDAQWVEAQSANLPAMDAGRGIVTPDALRLHTGRPRTSAYVVYMLMVGRGFFGGFKSSAARTLLLESKTMEVFLTNQGLRLPGFSTAHELVNAVSNDTRSFILDAQLREVLNERWDDFSKLLMDSTAVEGNTQWPKDSHLMADLVARLLHRGAMLGRLGLPRIDEPRAAKVLKKMVSLDKRISMGAGKPGSERERKKLYTDLLRLARKAWALLEPHVRRTAQALTTLQSQPSQHLKAARFVEWLRTDLQNLVQVIECCRTRVVENRKVHAADKVLSVADPDAALIVKGGREPVVGYKPQLGRSGAGFVVGLIVPQGNAADCSQLVPMFEQVVTRTGVTPGVVSTDDGYAFRTSRDHLMDAGAKVVSISGSKGKRITPPEDWDDPAYQAARNDRSAVESLMFTLKHGFDFGRVARRGLENVEAEMLEKVLAYNFCRMATCRRAAAKPGAVRAAKVQRIAA
jgi:IS5 family transposase